MPTNRVETRRPIKHQIIPDVQVSDSGDARWRVNWSYVSKLNTANDAYGEFLAVFKRTCFLVKERRRSLKMREP